LQAISEAGDQLLDAHAGVSQDSSQSAKGDFIMQWNCNGKLFGIRWMTEADVTALLPNFLVSELG
jgi:hypothetical protein